MPPRIPDPAPSRPRSLEVVVIEDDPAMGAVVREALRRDGHRVLLFENGLMAMAHLHAKLVDRLPMPDLLVTDIVLPGFKGLDIIASLRRAGCRTPIVVMTAFGSEETVERARDLGAIAVLDKPFDVDDLRTIVEGRRG